MQNMFENDFDYRKETKAARDQTGQRHEAEWNDGNVDQHAEPKPNELAETVSARPVRPLNVTHSNRPGVLGYLENQAVDIRIGRVRLSNFIRHKTAQAPKTRQVKFLWFVDDKIRDAIREPASGVTPPDVFFPVVDCKNNIAVFRLGRGKKLEGFGGRVLQIVVHGNNVTPGNCPQSGEDGIMLTKIPGQIEQRHRQPAFPGQLQGDGFGFVAAAVIHDD